MNMKTSLMFAVYAAAVAVPALAQDPVNLATGKPYVAPDVVPAGVYSIVPKETLVRYEVLHFGYSDYWGTFAGATGTLHIDPKNLAATTLDVKVPIVTVETTNRELNGELFSDEFFDAEKYPNMHFVSTGLTRTGPNTARLAGQLTMHNITKPVTLNVTFNGAGPIPQGFGDTFILGFKADGVVKRSDFGLGKFVPMVSDETKIFISASLKRE